MSIRQSIHIVDRESAHRAGLAKQVFSLGHHAEVYETLSELLSRPPQAGLILVRDDQAHASGLRGITAVFAWMAEVGVWLPVVATSQERDVDAVVAAMKAGALDYFILPMSNGDLGHALANVQGPAQRKTNRQRKLVEARNAIRELTKREQEVLQLLAEGCSNKEIGCALDISPRTVEIHRAKMMLKLSADHPADAVRIRFEAQLEDDGIASSGFAGLSSQSAPMH